MSVTKAAGLPQTSDRIIKSFPEVRSVFGKSGRAATATDPAPLEMFETIINLKPESGWRAGVTVDSLVAEMNKALQFPTIPHGYHIEWSSQFEYLARAKAKLQIVVPINLADKARKLGIPVWHRTAKAAVQAAFFG